MCDRRRDIRHARKHFPGIDFSLIDCNSDEVYDKCAPAATLLRDIASKVGRVLVHPSGAVPLRLSPARCLEMQPASFMTSD